MRKLTIIGGGKVGRVLGRLFQEAGVFQIQDVFCRSLAHARTASRFIGAGRAVNDYSRLRVADLFCIATPDDQIASCVTRLAAVKPFAEKTLIFHCSGSWSSALLQPLRANGVAIGSVHPIKSFARPEKAAQSFTGTFCGLEGDRLAKASLGRAFRAIGGRVLELDSAKKPLYHAAAVFACNYLVVMLDAAFELYGASGLDRKSAKTIAEPLIRETVANVLRFGPAKALTGPVARGDRRTVAAHYAALKLYDMKLAQIYKQLARAAARTVKRKS